MLPRWHILLGAIFALVILFFSPNIPLVYLALVFLSSFLIDFDHYLVSLYKNKKISLLESFKFFKKLQKIEALENKKGIRKKGHLFVFHTVEFHFLIAILGLFWVGFFYILLGMIFHSLLDIMYQLKLDRFYRREYFLTSWLIRSYKADKTLSHQ